MIQNSYTLTDIYKYYINKFDKNSKYNIEYNIYRSICNDFNKMISSKIINDGYFFKIPYRLGTLRVKKRKINLNNLRPNYKLFNSTNGKINNSHLNEHSGGYYVRFHWTKKKDAIVKNKTPYSFIATRENKRNLAKVIKDNSITQINKYFE